MFKRTYDLLSRAWQSTIRPFVGWAWTQIKRLHAWLEKTLAPALHFLKTVRTWILDHYDRWLRPIFQTIDAVRATLQVLETFHVPFARKLDQWLTAFEDRVNAKIGFALSKVNEAIGWIDRIVTFDGLFQRLTFLASVWKYERDMWHVWWASIRKREIENPKAPPAAVEPRSPTAIAAEVDTFIHGGETPGSAYAAEIAATALAWIRGPGARVR